MIDHLRGDTPDINDINNSMQQLNAQIPSFNEPKFMNNYITPQRADNDDQEI